jgi:hypothetical protein
LVIIHSIRKQGSAGGLLGLRAWDIHTHVRESIPPLLNNSGHHGSEISDRDSSWGIGWRRTVLFRDIDLGILRLRSIVGSVHGLFYM